VLLSQGTPMLLAGDEFARTQQGNNNAYCQDNEITWIDWEAAANAGDLVDFVRQLIRLRRSHPLLRRNRFLTDKPDAETGIRDVVWLTPEGDEMNQETWDDPARRCLGMLLDGRAPRSSVQRTGASSTLLLLLNAHRHAVTFQRPASLADGHWRLLVTTDANPPEFHSHSDQPFELAAHSLMLLQARAGHRAPPT
jgi:glycogen operon protein